MQNKKEKSTGIFAFPGEEISVIKHSIYYLFTKFTVLFTILIPQADKHQSRFAASNL
jgi:hypothetical protein